MMKEKDEASESTLLEPKGNEDTKLETQHDLERRPPRAVVKPREMVGPDLHFVHVPHGKSPNATTHDTYIAVHDITDDGYIHGEGNATASTCPADTAPPPCDSKTTLVATSLPDGRGRRRPPRNQHHPVPPP